MPLTTGTIDGMKFILAEDMFPGQPEDAEGEDLLIKAMEGLKDLPGILPETLLLAEAAIEAQRTGKMPADLLERLQRTKQVDAGPGMRDE